MTSEMSVNHVTTLAMPITYNAYDIIAFFKEFGQDCRVEYFENHVHINIGYGHIILNAEVGDYLVLFSLDLSGQPHVMLNCLTFNADMYYDNFKMYKFL